MAMMRPVSASAFALISVTPLIAASSTCRAAPWLSARDELCCPARHAHTRPELVTYRIAASFSGKGQTFLPRRDSYAFEPQLRGKSESQQNNGKLPSRKTGAAASSPYTGRPYSGQDAFFVSSLGNPVARAVAFGVADGVGGWTDSGVDPALFAHGLCRNMALRASVADQDVQTQGPMDAMQLLEEGYEDVLEGEDIRAGGSTAVLAIGQPNGQLEVANLGDSGFVQLRPRAIQYASEAQTHAFNTPYQLAKIPEQMMLQAQLFGNEPFHDLPYQAHMTYHDVRHGDVLVFASDGVWDNLSPGDILSVVNRHMSSYGAWMTSSTHETSQSKEDDADARAGVVSTAQLQNLTAAGGLTGPETTLQVALAVAITGEAKVTSMDRRRDGPFAREMHQAYPMERWQGGKVDDICVVVALVVRDPPET